MLSKSSTCSRGRPEIDVQRRLGRVDLGRSSSTGTTAASRPAARPEPRQRVNRSPPLAQPSPATAANRGRGRGPVCGTRLRWGRHQDADRAGMFWSSSVQKFESSTKDPPRRGARDIRPNLCCSTSNAWMDGTRFGGDPRAPDSIGQHARRLTVGQDGRNRNRTGGFDHHLSAPDVTHPKLLASIEAHEARQHKLRSGADSSNGGRTPLQGAVLRRARAGPWHTAADDEAGASARTDPLPVACAERLT